MADKLKNNWLEGVALSRVEEISRVTSEDVERVLDATCDDSSDAAALLGYFASGNVVPLSDVKEAIHDIGLESDVKTLVSEFRNWIIKNGSLDFVFDEDNEALSLVSKRFEVVHNVLESLSALHESAQAVLDSGDLDLKSKEIVEKVLWQYLGADVVFDVADLNDCNEKLKKAGVQIEQRRGVAILVPLDESKKVLLPTITTVFDADYVRELRKDRAKLQKLKGVEGQLVSANSTIGKLKRERDIVGKDLRAAAAEISTLKKEIARFGGKVNAVDDGSKEIEKLKGKIVELEELVNELRAENAELEEMLDAATSEATAVKVEEQAIVDSPPVEVKKPVQKSSTVKEGSASKPAPSKPKKVKEKVLDRDYVKEIDEFRGFNTEAYAELIIRAVFVVVSQRDFRNKKLRPIRRAMTRGKFDRDSGISKLRTYVLSLFSGFDKGKVEEFKDNVKKKASELKD